MLMLMLMRSKIPGEEVVAINGRNLPSPTKGLFGMKGIISSALEYTVGM